MLATRHWLRLGAAIAAAAIPVAMFAATGHAQDEFTGSADKLTVSGAPGSTQTAVFTVTSSTKRALAAPIVGPPAAGIEPLEPGAITITPNRAALVPHLPQVFRVVVVLPSEQKAYGASIDVKLVGDPAARAQKPFEANVNLTIAASVEPPASVEPSASAAPSQQLAPVGALKATEISCNPVVECFVAGFLTSESAVDRAIVLVIQNPGAIAATPSEKAFLAVGDRSNDTLTASQVPMASASAVEPGALGALEFSIPQQAPPDHYTGQVAVALPGVTAPVTASVDLTIRQGPLVPAILLVAGLVLGLWIRDARKTLVPAGDAAVRLSGIRGRIADAALSVREHGVLNERLDEAWNELLAQKTADATTMMDSIEETLALFEQFQTLQLALGNRQDQGAMDARQKIVDGRLELSIGEKGGADLDGARQLLQQAAGDAARAPLAQEHQGRASPGVVKQLEEPEPRGPASLPAKTKEQEAREKAQRRWLHRAVKRRNLVRGVMIAAAVVTGMYLLYVVPGAAFIGSGFGDSVSLLLWGFGSGWVDKVFVDWG